MLILKPLQEILRARQLLENGKVQRFIDSEVLRLCDPYIPMITGTLKRSGISGTTIGSGEVRYNANYAAQQYYHTADSRSYDPHRGAHWFERMKTDHKDELLRGAQKIAGGG